METKERFWVYTNWTEKHARVHRASCQYCNDGAGTDKEKGDKNGEWKGSFASYDRAKAEAENFIKAEHCPDTQTDCAFCNPQKEVKE